MHLLKEEVSANAFAMIIEKFLSYCMALADKKPEVVSLKDFL